MKIILDQNNEILMNEIVLILYEHLKTSTKISNLETRIGTQTWMPIWPASYRTTSSLNTTIIWPFYIRDHWIDTFLPWPTRRPRRKTGACSCCEHDEHARARRSPTWPANKYSDKEDTLAGWPETSLLIEIYDCYKFIRNRGWIRDRSPPVCCWIKIGRLFSFFQYIFYWKSMGHEFSRWVNRYVASARSAIKSQWIFPINKS